MKRLLILLSTLAVLATACSDSTDEPPPVTAVASVEIPGAPPALTHGDDALPPRPVGLTAQFRPEAPWPCEGDGTTGRRVQMLYVHGPGAASLASLRPTFEAYARQIEGVFLASARESGGERLVRFVTGADCGLDIIERTVSANALASFDAMVAELRASGLASPARAYHAWVESSSYCGIGTIYSDDRPTENANEVYAQYSRSDRPCWGYAEAHEIVHNLGGVQNSAPNATGGLHCRDEHDLMCYPDGGPDGQMITVCPDSGGEDRLDCRHNDYFNAAPNQDPSSYLSTHWDVARSSALTATVGSTSSTTTPPPTTSTTLPPTTSTSVGEGRTSTELVVPSTIRSGQPFEVRAVVTGDCLPTGTVAFYVSGRLMSRQVLDEETSPRNAIATATLTITGAVSRPTIRAEYSGDEHCATSRDSVRRRVSPA